MADIKHRHSGAALRVPAPERAQSEWRAPDPLLGLAELLFFAYRDFTGEADAVLAEIGYGRAHHRVLHFVARRPGLKVAELLRILKITKQSLGRVLRQLIHHGYIVQRPGEIDRRERLLFATASGQALAARLAAAQADRLRQGLDAVGPRGAESVALFLAQMVSAEEDAYSLQRALTQSLNAAGADSHEAPDAWTRNRPYRITPPTS
ncbi:MAG: MarR family transcriptional regulator [Hyphomicrobiales bacterium]|nr:MarR family transcriptional regulator [Hyphomicrobiales bacterium]